MSKWNTTPLLNSSDWMNYEGGLEWKYNSNGVFIKVDGEQIGPLRTPGNPITVKAIIDLYGHLIIKCSKKCNIPPELIIMTIGTETSNYRNVGFTGPNTFRWEPGVKVKDSPPSYRGDYSLGPMQILATTGRHIIRTSPNLDWDPEEILPAYRERPQVAPSEGELPGYDPYVNILLGSKYIRRRKRFTNDNPILVAAAYNSGRVKVVTDPESKYFNRWHLKSWGNHLDRAANWFGDACFVLNQLRTSFIENP